MSTSQSRRSPGLVGILLIVTILGLAVLTGWRWLFDPTTQPPPLMTVVEGRLTTTNESRPTLIASFRDAPPDIILYNEDRHAGPLRELTEEVVRRIGFSIKWVSLSFSKSLKEIADGNIDLIPYVFEKSPDRMAVSRFSISLGVRPRPTYFIVPKFKDHKVVIQKLEDLRGMKIGKRAGAHYFDELHTATHFTTLSRSDDLGVAREFNKGNVDVLLVNNKTASERMLVSLGCSEYEYADLVINRYSDMYFMYSSLPKHTQTFDRFDQVLLEMKQSGELADVYKSFGADPPDTSMQIIPGAADPNADVAPHPTSEALTKITDPSANVTVQESSKESTTSPSENVTQSVDGGTPEAKTTDTSTEESSQESAKGSKSAAGNITKPVDELGTPKAKLNKTPTHTPTRHRHKKRRRVRG